MKLTQHETNVRRILNFLASAGPSANIVVSGAECDSILQNCGGNILGCGTLYNILTQQVGPDTWKLTLLRAN